MNSTAKHYPSRLADKFMLRMPDGMRDLISKKAEENHRSMNSEIIARLLDSFEQDDAFKELGIAIVNEADMAVKEEQSGYSIQSILSKEEFILLSMIRKLTKEKKEAILILLKD